jgi:hypothetical protein
MHLVNGKTTGAAYAFVKPPAGWQDMTHTAKLTASDGDTGDRFGGSLAISEGFVIVGAYADDDSGSASGSAYVFAKPPAGWADMAHTAKLRAGDGAEYDNFGHSVAASGSTVVVGAITDDFSDYTDVGSTYLFSFHDPAGDLDQNGVVDLHDAVYALQFLSGITPSATVSNDADINGDERIGLADLLYILRKLALGEQK